MGLLKFFYNKTGRNYYIHVPIGLLIVNWIFQRIFRINSNVPFSVHYTSKIAGYEFMEIPDSSKTSFAVSGGAHIVTHPKAKLIVGENLIFAFNVCIHTINHDLRDRNSYHPKPVKIGNNCWIGSSATILPGVTLGDNVTVGANSVVTKSFPDNVVIGGCPAKIIKYLE